MIKGHICGGCKLGKGALEDGLHLVWRSFLPAGRDFIYDEYYQLAALCDSFCQHGINKVLKERTAMFKMGGEFIHPQTAMASRLLLGTVVQFPHFALFS